MNLAVYIELQPWQLILWPHQQTISLFLPSSFCRSLASLLPAHAALVFPRLSLLQLETQPMCLKTGPRLEVWLSSRVKHRTSLAVCAFCQMQCLQAGGWLSDMDFDCKHRQISLPVKLRSLMSQDTAITWTGLFAVTKYLCTTEVNKLI